MFSRSILMRFPFAIHRGIVGHSTLWNAPSLLRCIHPFQARCSMACDPEELRHVPLFALLDAEETAVLASQVELKRFAPRQRIYKIGDTDGHAYVMVSDFVDALAG